MATTPEAILTDLRTSVGNKLALSSNSYLEAGSNFQVVILFFVKQLSILLLISALSVLSLSNAASAKSQASSACIKYKRSMTRACTASSRKCTAATNAFNRCLKNAASPLSKKITPVNIPTVNFCASVYRPVCAVTGNGVYSIYSNECEAERVGATQISSEYCSSK